MTGVSRSIAAAALPRQHSRWMVVLCALAGLTLTATLLSRAVVNDDPFITYRYARNVASGAGFVYNPGEPILSTTAPLYGFLLAVLAILKIDPPVASLVIGSIATFAGSALLYRLGMRSRRAGPAIVSAALLATSPLVWMAVGMESSLFLALAIAAFNASSDRRWRIAALLAGLATLVRGDGLLIVGLVTLGESVERRSVPWNSILAAAATIVPAGILATIVYGSPFPATLQAKTLQAHLGITGFFPGASFLDGLERLAAAYLEHSGVYLAALPLIGLGLIQSRAQRWAWPIVAWGALQTVGYAALGVAPYRWYYIPILPALYVLMGIGIVAIASRVRARARSFPTVGLTLIMLATQARSIWEIHRATDEAVARSDLIGIDALPDTNGPVYQRVGNWLLDHTPADASVGVMEIGVIGYYSERRMIDLLGLLQPEVAAAIGRRDIFWSIPHLLPDYLVLTSVNPLYNYALLADDWFWATYVQAATFDDPRFRAGPIIIYRRQAAADQLIDRTADQTVGALRLLAYAGQAIALQPGMPIRIRLDWAKPDTPSARVAVSLIGPQGQVIAKSSRAYDTAAWPSGGGSVYHTMVTGPDVSPGIYRAYINVRTEDGSGETIIGVWKSPPGEVSLPPDLVSHAARFEDAIDLIGYTLEPAAAGGGDTVALTLYWRSRRPVERDYTVFVHLVDDGGRLALAADGQPRLGGYPTSIWSPGEVIEDLHTLQIPADLAAGTYRVAIGLYLLDGGQRLAVDGSDQVQLSAISIRGR
jgi:hypothetical protein